MKLQKVRDEDRKTLRERAYEILREAILNGEILPGERLRQVELSEKIGVSRIPVKEAIQRLAAEGLVIYDPHRGARVPTISKDDVQDIYTIRSVLEELATKLATPKLDRSNISELENLCTQIELCIEKGKLDKRPALNRKFHATIYQAAGHKRLFEIIERLWYTFPKNTFAQVPGWSKRSSQEHSRIVDAIKDGDSELSGKLMREHIANAGNALIEYLSSR